MQLSILIPNYNGESILPQFFPSVIKSAESFKGSYEIIVVDDASKDKSIDFFSNYKDKIKLHVHPLNKGFSGACNTAAALAQGEVLFFLNTDVELPLGFFDHFEAYFKEPETFAVTVHGFQYRTGKNLDGIKWGEWTRGQLRVTQNIYPEELHTKNIEGYGSRFISFGVQGAYFFVSTQKFRELGGFDERFNPYIFEETDLCYRAMKRDWKIYFEPKCKAKHDHSSTLNTEASKKKGLFCSFRNRILFTWKNIHETHLLFSQLFFLFIKLLSLSPIIWKAFFAAIKFLPSICESRAKEKQAAKRSDSDIFNSMREFYKIEPKLLQSFAPVITTAVLFLIHELACDLFFTNVTMRTAYSYFISFLFSLSFWGSILEIQKVLSKKMKWGLSFFISGFFSLLFVLQALTFKEFGEYSNSFMLNYLADDFSYVFDNLFQQALVGQGLVFILIAFIFFQIWSPYRDSLFVLQRKTSLLRGFIFLIVAFVLLNQLKWETGRHVKFADGALMSALASTSFTSADKD